MTAPELQDRLRGLLREAKLHPSDLNAFAPSHDPNDRKLAEVVHPFDAENDDLSDFGAALVGFRSHEGVERNHGRPGAEEAPQAIRRTLFKLAATSGDGAPGPGSLRICDLGDAEVEGGDLESAQERLGKAVGACLLANVLPVVLGGGHETAFGHFLGYVEAAREVAIVNLDAHLDVREAPRATSGTPFRQALEHPSGLLGGRYACLGARGHANCPAYVDYAKSKGAAIEWFGNVRGEKLSEALMEAFESAGGAGVLATFDMDAVSSAFAPGVSAASPEGFSADEFLEASALAGRSVAVSSFEISEVSPPLDLDGRTARLAALAVWRFLAARALAKGA